MAAAKKPVNYDQLFPGRFLKSGLFCGKAVTLTIKDVDTDSLPTDDGKDKVRGVISFKETAMQLTLNSTNGQCIRGMFGKQLSNWIGQRITFVSEQDKFGRETVDAIRIQGSPDLKQAIRVEIRLPRKKPKFRDLIPTGKGPQDPAAIGAINAAAEEEKRLAEQNTEPPAEIVADPDTGEVIETAPEAAQ